MFGSLSHKIAHASTIPSLGNQDLRALQDLITREKEVVASYVSSTVFYRPPADDSRLLSNDRIQRLSGELARANEALKAWGQGEGLDLGVSFGPETT
jgi:hypothetical protein